MIYKDGSNSNQKPSSSIPTSHTIMASWLVPFFPCCVYKQATELDPLANFRPGTRCSSSSPKLSPLDSNLKSTTRPTSLSLFAPPFLHLRLLHRLDSARSESDRSRPSLAAGKSPSLRSPEASEEVQVPMDGK